MPRSLVFILFCASLLFCSQLPTELVYDDILLIGKNQTLAQPSLSKIFTQHLWEGTPNFDGTSGSYYRPLMILSLVIDRVFFGENIAFYHLHSIFWHLLCCAFLWFWLAKYISHQKILFASVFCFAIHPANVEIVAFLAARNDSMACVGILAMLLAIKNNRSMGIFLALIFALLSKESALLIPPAYIFFHCFKEKKPPKKNILLPILAAFSCYFSLRFFADIPWPTRPSSSIADLGIGFLIYLDHAFFPDVLLPGSHILWPTTKEIIGGCLGFVALLFLLYKSPYRILGGVLFIAGLIPAFSAIGSTGLAADRYLYLPMMGLLLLIASSCEQYKTSRMTTPISIVIILYMAIHSFRILPSWSNNIQLFADAVSASPSPFRAGAYAKALEEKGDLDLAADWYEHAVQPPNPNPHSCYNITWIHFLRQDFARIITAGEKALAAGCEPSAELTAPLSLAHALNGNWERARMLSNHHSRDPRNIFSIVRTALKARDRDENYFHNSQQSSLQDALKLLDANDPQSAAWLRERVQP